MHKKLLVLITVAVILISACTFPTAFEIRGKPRLNLSTSFNLDDILANVITGIDPGGEGMKILSYTNYRDQDAGKDLQAILLQMNFPVPGLEVLRSFISFHADFATEYPPIEEEPVDLSMVSDIMEGFEFAGIESRLYINGDGFKVLFNSPPGLALKAEYTRDNIPVSVDLLDIAEITNSGELVIDPEGTGKFEGPMPGGGIPLTNFGSILSDSPRDLRIIYEIKDLSVTRKMLEGVDLEQALSIQILALVPLHLVAGAGARIAFPVSEEQTDLLARDKPGSFSLDWINSLKLKITMTNPVFPGGTLYLDDRINEDDPDGRSITIPLDGKTLRVNISQQDIDYINGKWPYQPKIGILFDAPAELMITKNLGILNIDFEADMNYRIELGN